MLICGSHTEAKKEIFRIKFIVETYLCDFEIVFNAIDATYKERIWEHYEHPQIL
jgi:hypothetical protein